MTVPDVLTGVPIHAYIDIGSAGLLMQVILAGALGSLFILRSSIFTWTQRIKNIFVRNSTDAPPHDSGDQS